MIISASRRTDIPAFYSNWFFNRLKDGFVLVPYPRNPGKYRRVELNSKTVDCFIFWTKNPLPMIKSLDLLVDYNFYFHYTLTPYEKDIETFLPNVDRRIQTFKRLSEKIGKERVIWRYDPIFVNNEHSLQFHCEAFEKMASQLEGYTDTCIISFIDDYNHVKKTMKYYGIQVMQDDEIQFIADTFSAIAIKYNIILQTCAESVDLEMYGITHAACIDKNLIERMTNTPFIYRKDKNQRTTCNCMESIDIGTYDTCPHGCIYCYATTKMEKVIRNTKLHNPKSPKMIGVLEDTDEIIEVAMTSLKSQQTSLFK